MKKYFSELFLITTIDDINLFKLWIFWHNVIIGFDHIIIIDNGTQNENDIKSICSKYVNIEYVKNTDTISQSDFYNKYVSKSSAYWFMPIDDDEFLYISDKYNHNINMLIKEKEREHQDERFFKYSFSWAMMASDKVYDLYENELFNVYDRIVPIDNVLNKECVNDIKTIVNTTITHKWLNNSETKSIYYDNINDISYNKIPVEKIKSYDEIYSYNNCEHIGSVHNPLSINNNLLYHAYNISNNMINVGYMANALPTGNEDALLLHFKYRSVEEWVTKCTRKRFYDTSNEFYDEFYNINQYYAFYNIAINNNIIFDKPKKLFNFCKEIFNMN